MPVFNSYLLKDIWRGVSLIHGIQISHALLFTYLQNVRFNILNLKPAILNNILIITLKKIPFITVKL